MVAEAWDYKKNTVQNFFNDGLQVIDPNYVEPTPPEPYEYECKDPELNDIKVWTMMNCNFNEYKEQQEQRALEKMIDVCPDCLLPEFHDMKEYFAHQLIPRVDRLDNPETILLLESEAQRALEYSID